MSVLHLRALGCERRVYQGRVKGELYPAKDQVLSSTVCVGASSVRLLLFVTNYWDVLNI